MTEKYTAGRPPSQEKAQIIKCDMTEQTSSLKPERRIKEKRKKESKELVEMSPWPVKSQKQKFGKEAWELFRVFLVFEISMKKKMKSNVHAEHRRKQP